MKHQTISPGTGTHQHTRPPGAENQPSPSDYNRSYFYFSPSDQRDVGLYSYVREALSTLKSRASGEDAACGGGARQSSLHASAASATGAREEPTRSDQ